MDGIFKRVFKGVSGFLADQVSMMFNQAVPKVKMFKLTCLTLFTSEYMNMFPSFFVTLSEKCQDCMFFSCLFKFHSPRS